MAIYCATILAKPGEESAVAENLRQTVEFLKTVPGYRGGHMLQSQPGAFIKAVQTLNGTTGQPAPEDGHDAVQFILVEIWESEAARAGLSKLPGYAPLHHGLVPHLQPAHTHEFYEDLTGH